MLSEEVAAAIDAAHVEPDKRYSASPSHEMAGEIERLKATIIAIVNARGVERKTNSVGSGDQTEPERRGDLALVITHRVAMRTPSLAAEGRASPVDLPPFRVAGVENISRR